MQAGVILFTWSQVRLNPPQTLRAFNGLLEDLSVRYQRNLNVLCHFYIYHTARCFRLGVPPLS